VSVRRTDPWNAAMQATSTQDAPDGGVQQW